MRSYKLDAILYRLENFQSHPLFFTMLENTLTVSEGFFHRQVKKPSVNITMNNKQIEVVDEFKYLGFTWTEKLSLRPTIEKCIGNIHRSLVKLKWLKSRRHRSTTALRQCFFAYTFHTLPRYFPSFHSF